MNGPSHYSYAEKLLENARDAKLGSDLERYTLAAAQAFSTLALAAATIDAAHGELSIPADAGWKEVTS